MFTLNRRLTDELPLRLHFWQTCIDNLYLRSRRWIIVLSYILVSATASFLVGTQWHRYNRILACLNHHGIFRTYAPLGAPFTNHKLTMIDRQLNDPLINFQAHVVPHIPRAWERAPHKPFAPQHRGRKVWKRYNLRSKELEQPTQTMKGQEGSGSGDERFADTNRPIKRQCITNAPDYPGAQESEKPPKYITTLRARAPGTPRS